MEEPRRDKQVNLKLSEVEDARLKEAAARAGMAVAGWCRTVLLQAARGERAAQQVEVREGDLNAIQVSVERLATLQLATLDVLLEHTHHGDPQALAEDPNVRELGRKRARRKLETLMVRIGLAGPPAGQAAGQAAGNNGAGGAAAPESQP